jgi:hypothetical protein
MSFTFHFSDKKTGEKCSKLIACINEQSAREQQFGAVIAACVQGQNAEHSQS